MARKFESADPLRRGVRRTRPPFPRNAAMQKLPKSLASGLPAGISPAPPGTTPLPPGQTPSLPGSGFDAALNTPTIDPVTGNEVKYQEFALKMCTEEDMKDSRYHVLKFRSRELVDPKATFVPPIRLHKRDPKQLQNVVGEGMDDEEGEESLDDKMAVDGAEGGVDSKDGVIGKPQSAEAKAQVALGEDGKSEQKRRPFGKKRKTRQVYGGEKNEAARKLRYEEHYPWVMEDFDNTNTWISSYEAAQSNCYAILTYDQESNGFKVIPIEKFYKMNPAAKYATLSLEDAEERMEGLNVFKNRWLMSKLQPNLPTGDVNYGAGSLGTGLGGISNGPSAQTPYLGKLRTVVGSEERQHKYNLDEELDYDEQEMFDDDEGAPILDGPEEELKEAEQRIKREQLKANELMEVGKDEDIDKLFDDEFDEKKENKQGKKLRRALRSLEKNQYYDSDEEENPYASEEDHDDDSMDELTNDANALELGTTVKQEEEDLAIPVLSQFRKKHIDKDTLPHGTIVLQLPPNILSKFPRGEWNPNAKRETEAPVVEDPKLLTREDVRSRIVSGETDIKHLLTALRPKLAQHKDNVDRLRQFVKEVARSKDKKLYLRN